MPGDGNFDNLQNSLFSLETGQQTARQFMSPAQFPEQVNYMNDKLKLGTSMLDHGIELPQELQVISDAQPKKRGVLSLDPVCISCSKQQTDIIKSFKFACLQYAPSPVNFRNIEFTRA